MEVSRRKVLQKHLVPARPLRRCSHVDAELQMNAATCAEAFMVEEIIYGLKQAYKIVNFQEKAKDKISYTREFLIGLASCPEAKKKPESLPDHPIVLSEVRDPSCLNLSEAWIREGHDERF